MFLIKTIVAGLSTLGFAYGVYEGGKAAVKLTRKLKSYIKDFQDYDGDQYL